VVSIEGKDLKIRAKTYEQGPYLNIIETVHDGPVAATPAKGPAPPFNPAAAEFNKATWSNLAHGGCNTRNLFHNNAFPPSKHMTKAPRHRIYE